MASFSPTAPTIYQADPLGSFQKSYGITSGIVNEDNAKATLGDYAQSLYGVQPGNGAAASGAPATPGGPDLMKFGLPDQQTLMGMLRDPETRQQGLDLISNARTAYATANDPETKLKLQKLKYEVQHQGDAPRDTVTMDANTRFKLGTQQGLTGDALREFTLTGKLPDAPGGNAPSGYMAGPADADGNPTLVAIKGGPADPNNSKLSDAALDLISTQYLAGDKSAISGYARNAAMRAQVANAVAEKANAMGMDGKALAAEISSYGGNVAAQRAAGTRAAQVGMAASEANSMADIALKASAAVPRTALVPWNAAVNAVNTNTSSPEMAAFVTATTSLVNAYARAVSPLGAPTDAMRQHAEAMLNTAQGPDAYAAVIAQMKKEMEAALEAPEEISGNLKSSVSGKPDGDNDPLGIR